MRRLRLKADGRIVELLDGQEAPLAPEAAAATASMPPLRPRREAGSASEVRELRLRSRLTQAEFANKLCVPIETIRNWEQGKRMPRGPARAPRRDRARSGRGLCGAGERTAGAGLSKPPGHGPGGNQI